MSIPEAKPDAEKEDDAIPAAPVEGSPEGPQGAPEVSRGRHAGDVSAGMDAITPDQQRDTESAVARTTAEKKREEIESGLSGEAKEQYDAVQDTLKSMEEDMDLDPEAKKTIRALADLYFQGLLYFSKFMNAQDSFPGRFFARVKSDPKLSGKYFEKPGDIINAHSEEGKAKAKDKLAIAQSKLAEFKAAGQEKGAVSFLASTYLGESGAGIDSADSLAANLMNSSYTPAGSTESKKLYTEEAKSLDKFTSGAIPYGSIIFFWVQTGPDQQEGILKHADKVKTAAICIDSASKTFQYYDARSGLIKTFVLGAAGAEVNKATKNFMGGFKPNFSVSSAPITDRESPAEVEADPAPASARRESAPISAAEEAEQTQEEFKERVIARNGYRASGGLDLGLSPEEKRALLEKDFKSTDDIPAVVEVFQNMKRQVEVKSDTNKRVLIILLAACDKTKNPYLADTNPNRELFNDVEGNKEQIAKLPKVSNFDPELFVECYIYIANIVKEIKFLESIDEDELKRRAESYDFSKIEELKLEDIMREIPADSKESPTAFFHIFKLEEQKKTDGKEEFGLKDMPERIRILTTMLVVWESNPATKQDSLNENTAKVIKYVKQCMDPNKNPYIKDGVPQKKLFDNIVMNASEIATLEKTEYFDPILFLRAYENMMDLFTTLGFMIKHAPSVEKPDEE